ncbi:hypothetical protein F2Q68_00034424 [Brassica cretica]|uniref:Uncharacterized protein n=1 Tax=Brassica cretica TaxID=69181 RepID=A0A8S9H266_BRACR|nr:hypothetical protein F2Q68_00034424 [Brassica cretica]
MQLRPIPLQGDHGVIQPKYREEESYSRPLQADHGVIQPKYLTWRLNGEDQVVPSLSRWHEAKLDNVHKLLRKQVCLVEDAEAVDTEGRAEEEDVNFFSGSGFQGSGNHGGFWKPWWKYGGEGREAARRRFRSRESDELQRIALVSINPSNKHRSLEVIQNRSTSSP